MAWGFFRQIPSIIWYESCYLGGRLAHFQPRNRKDDAGSMPEQQQHAQHTPQATQEPTRARMSWFECWEWFVFVGFLFVLCMFLNFLFIFFQNKNEKNDIISKHWKKFKLACLFGLNEVCQKPSEFRPKFRKYWNLLKSLTKRISKPPSPAPKNSSNALLQQQKFK